MLAGREKRSIVTFYGKGKHSCAKKKNKKAPQPRGEKGKLLKKGGKPGFRKRG